MQISKQSAKIEKESKKQIAILQKLLKSQKTFQLQYEIVKQLMQQLDQPSSCDFQLFKLLYNGLSKQIRNTLIFRRLNYKIWNDGNLPVQIRDKTQFFRIVSEWIVMFQMKVNDLTNFKKQIQFLTQFFGKEITGVFQKIVLIDEIHEDLIQLLGRQFWQLQQIQPLPIQKAQPTKQQASQLLKLLNILIQYYQFFQSEQPEMLHNSQLYLLRNKCQHYIQFIYCSLQYILSINSGKKQAQQCLQKYQEMQLTRIALIFLQRNDIGVEGGQGGEGIGGYLDTKKCVRLLQMLMLRTSKIVRYAMVVEYVRYYQFLEKNSMDYILQQLQNMVYFRELIIGQSQIGQAGLTTPNLTHPLQSLHLPARSKHRILLSHQKQYGKYSIIQFEFTIEGGDINLAIYNIKNNKQVLHWKQERTEDRRIDVMLKEEGLYIVEVDNLYSWIKAKKVAFRVDQFCVGVAEQQQVQQSGVLNGETKDKGNDEDKSDTKGNSKEKNADKSKEKEKVNKKN